MVRVLRCLGSTSAAPYVEGHPAPEFKKKHLGCCDTLPPARMVADLPGKVPDVKDVKARPCILSAAKCSKSRDLTAIAICDSNRESQITSDLRQCQPPWKSSLL